MLRSILSTEKSNKLSNSSSKYSNNKSRADLALVKRKLADTRTKAAALIMAGKVYSNQKRIEKAFRKQNERRYTGQLYTNRWIMVVLPYDNQQTSNSEKKLEDHNIWSRDYWNRYCFTLPQ